MYSSEEFSGSCAFFFIFKNAILEEQMKINKQKIFEIILTAIISAGIAFLQSLASSHFMEVNPEQTATVAGLVGGVIRSCRV